MNGPTQLAEPVRVPVTKRETAFVLVAVRNLQPDKNRQRRRVSIDEQLDLSTNYLSHRLLVDLRPGDSPDAAKTLAGLVVVSTHAAHQSMTAAVRV